jgi:hypothetical protein
MVSHTTFLVVFAFLLICFVPAGIAMAANSYAFNRLNVWHKRVYLDLGAPSQNKMNSLNGEIRRKWQHFIRRKEYLRLNDPKLTTACNVAHYCSSYATVLSVVVLCFFIYYAIQCDFRKVC